MFELIYFFMNYDAVMHYLIGLRFWFVNVHHFRVSFI
jgi:hypothetical protein